MITRPLVEDWYIVLPGPHEAAAAVPEDHPGFPVVNGSAVKWTLKRNRDDLEGTVYRAFNNTTSQLIFKKAR